MSPNEAAAVLDDVEGIFQQLSNYHHLSEEQRLALHSRAGLVRQKLGDVGRLMKKLVKAGETESKDLD